MKTPMENARQTEALLTAAVDRPGQPSDPTTALDFNFAVCAASSLTNPCGNNNAMQVPTA